ncbi:MAG: hypothetical protein WB987_04080 [Candidatus Acidiferrales bacterium]
MPGDIIEIAPEPAPQSNSSGLVHAFADQYAQILAEHSIQNQQAQRASHGLPRWLALAVALGGVIAFAFVYFLVN